MTIHIQRQRTDRYIAERLRLLNTNCQSWPWREQKKPAQVSR